MDIQQAQMNVRKNEMMRAQQQAAMLMNLTATIAGPLVAVDYAAALRKAQDEEGIIPGQTDGMMQIEIQRPLQLAHNLAATIMKGPQKAANAQQPQGA